MRIKYNQPVLGLLPLKLALHVYKSLPYLYDLVPTHSSLREQIFISFMEF